LLSAEQIGAILDALPGNARSAPEITMEANPGTVTPGSLRAFRNVGINRLSIGVQSFHQAELDFLTRIHSPEQARAAVLHAREAGFENVNMDIMFALPGQTVESLRSTLEQVIALAPDHVSAYSLVYERGTPLYAQLGKGLVIPTPDDADAEMYELVTTMLADAGYEQYEVSNFAKPGRECRHNLAYWHAEDHFSFGPSAHGLIQGERYWNHRSLTSWTQLVEMGRLPHANTETLSGDHQLTELIFLTLRADGIPVLRLQTEFGLDIRLALEHHLPDLMAAGYITDTGSYLRLTARGYAICDEITGHVMSALTPHVSHR
jgi:oxygen-independent coproporphyrinogen-3 oxidase